MKNCIFLLISFLSFSCTHKVIRSGYVTTEREYIPEHLVITRYLPFSDSLYKVGEVRLQGRYAADRCSEADALAILRSEATKLKADVVNISNESRPGIVQKCYKCTAEFYQKFDSIPIKTDEEYSYSNVSHRVEKDNSLRTIGILIGICCAFIPLFLTR